jgi:hypothetical protein
MCRVYSFYFTFSNDRVSIVPRGDHGSNARVSKPDREREVRPNSRPYARKRHCGPSTLPRSIYGGGWEQPS